MLNILNTLSLIITQPPKNINFSIFSIALFFNIAYVRSHPLSLKDNIIDVKNELSAEEKFLESSIKAERLFNKYKYPLIGLVLAIIIAIAGTQIYAYIEENKLVKANEAYNKLLKDPKDKTALEALKSNNADLYALFVFKEAINNQDVALLQEIVNEKRPFISSIASYELASKESNMNTLKEYADSGNSLKDLAAIQSAYLLIQEEKYQEARNVLDKIPSSSKLSMMAQTYKHFLATKAQ